MEKSFLTRFLPETACSDVGPFERVLHRSRADVGPGHDVDLDPEVRRVPHFRREVGGHDRPQFHDGVVTLFLHPACANDKAATVELQVLSVEEVHLANLGIERIDPKCCCPSAAVLQGNGQLQLDAVGIGDQREEFGELAVREGRRRGCRGHHRSLLWGVVDSAVPDANPTPIQAGGPSARASAALRNRESSVTSRPNQSGGENSAASSSEGNSTSATMRPASLPL